jgi:hypothetical protein
MTTATKSRSRRKAPTRASVEAAAKRKAELFDKLEAWEDETDQDTIDAAVAMFAAIDDGYSDRNAMLIAMQDPEATKVAGYRQWQDVGRQVGSYPEGQGGITIVRFAGSYKSKDADGAGPSADFGAKPAEHDAAADDAKAKERNRFALTTVHDIRWTTELRCATCDAKIHRTGYDKATKRHTWTHSDQLNVGHPVELPRRPVAEDAEQAGTAE